jgi:hypothetical protein
VVLEFDHQGGKVANVNQLVADGVSWPTILAEIMKCEVVCANDHRHRTARTFGYYRTAAAVLRAGSSTVEQRILNPKVLRVQIPPGAPMRG